MNDTLDITSLLTRKNALNETRVERQTANAQAGTGEIWLRIDRFALTTNNITYAAYGDSMQYWNFFPTGQADWGHMPVWGFADVVSSGVDGVEIGERFYGYFPIASHVRMNPVRVTPRGFYDGAEHRQTLTSAYNQYTRCSNDPVHAPADENFQALMRPLFITSFMLADFLEDNNFFGARRLVVSSASSKTAYGTAFCLQQTPALEVVGITSPRNQDFVDGLGCYQRSVTYDQLTTLDTDTPTLYVDFSGDESLRGRVHSHFGDALVYDCFAGSAQNTDLPNLDHLPGPKPIFYFAPVQIRKRNIDWGPAVVNTRFGAAQSRFIRHVAEPKNNWAHVVEHTGWSAIQKLVEDLVAGRTQPIDAHIVRMS